MEDVSGYKYHYAVVFKNEKHRCLEVMDSMDEMPFESDEQIYIRLDVYNKNYLFKFYNPLNGQWYIDEEYKNRLLLN